MQSCSSKPAAWIDTGFPAFSKLWPLGGIRAYSRSYCKFAQSLFVMNISNCTFPIKDLAHLEQMAALSFVCTLQSKAFFSCLPEIIAVIFNFLSPSPLANPHLLGSNLEPNKNFNSCPSKLCGIYLIKVRGFKEKDFCHQNHNNYLSKLITVCWAKHPGPSDSEGLPLGFVM